MMYYYSLNGRTCSVERKKVSIFDVVVYDRGPAMIMPNAPARQGPHDPSDQKSSLEPGNLSFRWIHLPANNANVYPIARY